MLCIDVNSNYVGYRSFGTVTRKKKLRAMLFFFKVLYFTSCSQPGHDIYKEFVVSASKFVKKLV
jgi:hypothetical protein